LEVAEAAGRRFDALDFRVQSFRHGVGEVMAEIGQQIFQMLFEQVGHVGRGFELAAAPRQTHP
jgi:hypothetical protein